MHFWIIYGTKRQSWENNEFSDNKNARHQAFWGATRAARTEKCVALHTYILTYKEEKVSVITKLSTFCCSVTKLCLTLCNTMDCSMSGFRVLHYLPEFAQTRVHPTISSSVVPVSSSLQSFPASGSFPVSWLFTSGGQSTGAQLQPHSIQRIFRVGFL